MLTANTHDARTEAKLRALIEHAVCKSPYHAQRFHGLEHASLQSLPTLTKTQLMAHWDEIVCDRELKRDDIDLYLRQPPSPDLYQRRYFAVSTSGTTRQVAVVAFNRREWMRILAGVAHAARWRRQAYGRGVRVMIGGGAEARKSMSQTLWQSITALRAQCKLISCGEPLEKIVAALNAAQPESISAYASALSLLAEEQRSGRLHISPRWLLSSAEVCSPKSKARIEEAFGVPVDETYIMAEAGVVAASCYRRKGMHVMNEDVIVEPVDTHNHPVPTGVLADKLLVTVLHSRTLPLIRYEVPDRVRLSTSNCDCGLPGPLIAEVQGRRSEVLELVTESGGVARISAWEFESVIAPSGMTVWQVISQPSGLTLRILPGHSAEKVEATRERVERLLRRAGVQCHVVIEPVPAFVLSGGGKLDRLVCNRATN